jgi:hypothetical protein
MQRRQVDAVFNCPDDFVGNQHGLFEALAAMNHAMTNRLNVGNAFDLFNACFRRRSPARDEVNCRIDVTQRRS